MQKDSQTLFTHPAWQEFPRQQLSAAWYERTFAAPKSWAGRRIALSLEYLNSFAVIMVDGKRCGEARFPGGEVDLTEQIAPGQTQTLTVLVEAMALKGVLLSYSDSNSAREVKGRVERRGLCGDVWLKAEPRGPRISDVKVETSFRRGEILIDAALPDLDSAETYSLRVSIRKEGHLLRELSKPVVRSSDLVSGRIRFAQEWRPDALWDIHTPQNQHEVSVSLANANGEIVDSAFPVRFGFREFWIEGRDFYLNGTRIYLCAIPLDNAQVGAAWATYAAAKESMERLKSIGLNFVYTHNYGCEPGSHLGFSEILRAADDVGMLVSFSQPHFSHYDWKGAQAEGTNGYAAHAEFYVRAAQNHPSVIAYSMSHNATGYEEDMNPDLMDGIQNPRDAWSERNSKVALRAEEIVHRLDPSRTVYHHASGNLGSMHTINFYPNFVPPQELSDWFGGWATNGTKPMFTCEYGAPFTWDWTMYRGWYKGQREFGSAVVPWDFSLAEWNAQFLGDAAFPASPRELANIRWEAKQFAAGKLWHRWDYPNAVGSPSLVEQDPIFALYFDQNWPAFRAWGVSAISPWEYSHHWRLKKGVERRRENLKVDWDNLQRAGFSPDYIDQRYERMDLAFGREDWEVAPGGKALLKYNQPLMAWLGGPSAEFTRRDHTYTPGETLERSVIVINNSRVPAAGQVTWEINLPDKVQGKAKFSLPTGTRHDTPIHLTLPMNVRTGTYSLRAETRFDTGMIQTDTFDLHVIAAPSKPASHGRWALFDPKGETGRELARIGFAFTLVQADADLSGFEGLIVGKRALSPEGAAPDVSRVREGLKVLLFEQSAATLEKRFGFRIAEYGLRNVFPRVPDHPLLSGVTSEHLRDWRGDSTLNPPRLDYELRPRYGPTIRWCDIPVPQLWRCGNRGNVASIVIEKPVRGDFLPIIDGGFDLQYSPLMEYREGSGMILFCQLDVTGRTEREPAAEVLISNMLTYLSGWGPSPRKNLIFAGNPDAKAYLEAAGFALSPKPPEQAGAGDVLLITSGASAANLEEAKGRGAGVVLAGFSESTFTGAARFEKREYISAGFPPPSLSSVFRGISPADTHIRQPRMLPLLKTGAETLASGALGAEANGSIIVCQLLPWDFAGTNNPANLRKSARRIEFLFSRLMANAGVASQAPLLERFRAPTKSEKRWAGGLYLDTPEEWDYPYRFFRW